MKHLFLRGIDTTDIMILYIILNILQNQIKKLLYFYNLFHFREIDITDIILLYTNLNVVQNSNEK